MLVKLGIEDRLALMMLCFERIRRGDTFVRSTGCEDLRKRLVVSDEEKARVSWKEDIHSGTIEWDKRLDTGIEFDFSEDDVALIVDLLQQHNKAGAVIPREWGLYKIFKDSLSGEDRLSLRIKALEDEVRKLRSLIAERGTDEAL